MEIKMENMCKDRKKTFHSFLKDLNEEILRRSFTEDKVYQYTCTYKGKCVYVVYNGKNTGNNNAYWMAQNDSYQNPYSYISYNSTYDLGIGNSNITDYDDLETYDILIIDDYMVQSKRSYTLFCVKNMFREKIFFHRNFKRGFSIEEANQILQKFDETNEDVKMFEADTNLYYVQTEKHGDYHSVLYKDGEDAICFYIYDDRYDNCNYVYHNDRSRKISYGTFPPKVKMVIQHGDIRAVVYKHEMCDILKRIGNQKLTEIFFALFTDFDKMRKKTKGYVKKILHKQYDKLRKPLYVNDYMTVKVRNPIGDCANRFYYRTEVYNDIYALKIKSSKKEELMKRKAHEVMIGVTGEFQYILKNKKVLEFTHGYVYMDKDNQKHFYIKSEHCGVISTDENLPNRVSKRNREELVLTTEKLLKEYEKKKCIMVRLSGKPEAEMFS